jgi:hypothetical protein
MSRRRRIRIAAFVALLVAWPIFFECAKRRFPSEAGVHGVLAVVSLLIYVAIAAVLRSRVIAGFLGGVLVWAITNPFPDMRDPDYVPEWWGRLFLWSVIGFFVGIGWEGLHTLKLPPPDRPDDE